MLRKQIVNDQIQALKNHDQEKLSLLRYILAQIKNKEIEKKSELIDEEVTVVLRKITKELNESIEAFKKGERDDLVVNCQKQLNIITPYLPKEISDDELKKEIEKIIADNQDTFKDKSKAIIGFTVGKLKSKADPSRIVRLLQIMQKQ